ASAVAPDKREFVTREVLQASAAARDKAEKAVAAARAKVQKTAPDDKASAALALAELEFATAQARHDALKAVLDVEKLEDAGKIRSAEWSEAALAANKAQRALAVHDAKFKVFQAKNPPAPPKGKKVDPAKALADAVKLLAKAEADEKKPLDTNYTKRDVKVYPAQSSGRRLAFARWIVNKENPLAARVAVNHMWLRHFG